jgi:hypothetical protein
MSQNFQRIANLPPEKLALFFTRLKGESVETKQDQVTPRGKGNHLIPLSFAQQRLWFIDQLDPNTPAYNMPAPVRFTGPMNLPVLDQSLQEIVRRHEALRTTFEAVEGQPVQIIARELKLSIPLIDLSSLSQSERMAEARRLTSEDGMKPFDLTKGPLLRVTLLRLGEQDHAIRLTMHHIITDGWSIGVFFRELRVLYQAYLAGDPSPLPELTIHYPDYAIWQRQWLRKGAMEQQLAYWHKQLAGAPAVLELPMNHPRPAVQSSRGMLIPLVIPRDLTVALKYMSRREGVTLFMNMVAAFQALLHCYTASLDIAVGTNVANRSHQQMENLIGFFINQLVLRTDLSGNPTFRELLVRVRNVALGAYANQDVPFEKVVDALKPERSLAQQPLFQFKIDLQNAPVSSLHLPGFTLRPLDIDITVTHTDLTLSMLDSGNLITGFIQYSTDLSEASTIERMLEHYRMILNRVVTEPQVHLTTLKSMIAEADAQHRTTKEEEYKDFRLLKLKNIQRRVLSGNSISRQDGSL